MASQLLRRGLGGPLGRKSTSFSRSLLNDWRSTSGREASAVRPPIMFAPPERASRQSRSIVARQHTEHQQRRGGGPPTPRTMLGRTPGKLRQRSPHEDGVIADSKSREDARPLIKKAHGRQSTCVVKAAASSSRCRRASRRSRSERSGIARWRAELRKYLIIEQAMAAAIARVCRSRSHRKHDRGTSAAARRTSR